MRKILLTSLWLLSFCVIANAQKKTFMRVYHLSGAKIEKGFLKTTTDSSIVINKRSGTTEIPVSKIGHIKTRRSLGHDILIGSVIGGSGLGILLAASADYEPSCWICWTVGEGLVGGLIIGAIGGGAVGTLTGVFKRSVVFTINGDENMWGKQRAVLTTMQIEN
jgi:hypothetical protein